MDMYWVYTKFWQKDWLKAAKDLADAYHCTLVDVHKIGFFDRILQFTIKGRDEDRKHFEDTFRHWLRTDKVRYAIW